MKQVTQSRYGGPEVLEIREVPRPAPRENEVLVRVGAFSVTLADCAFRKADPFIVRFFAGLFRPKNLVLGDDIGGTVAAVGKGVTRFAIGDAVFGSVGSSLGGAAEYVCLAESGAVVLRPEGLDAGQGAGLSYSFLTAMPFIRDEAQVIVYHGYRPFVGSGTMFEPWSMALPLHKPRRNDRILASCL